MIRLRKSLFPIGVAGLALATLTLSLPKAAHAVAAALVQVTNTASNPVVTQSIGQQAGQSIQIACSTHFGICNQMGLSGNAPTYVVPAGQFFVITAVDVTSFGSTGVGCPTAHLVTLSGLPPNNTIGFEYSVPANSGTRHFSYPSGVVFPSGVTPDVGGATLPTGCTDDLWVYGYLTSN